MKEKKYLIKEEWVITYNDSDLGTEHYTENSTFDTLDEARALFKTMFIGIENSKLSYIIEDGRTVGIHAIMKNYDGSTDNVNIYLYEIKEMRLAPETFGDYDEISDSEGREDTD